MYDGFSSDESYANTLTALNMFKVAAIIIMVLLGIVLGISGFALLFSYMSGIFFLFILAFVGGIAFLIIKFYFLALFGVIGGIRDRIYNRKFAPLEGLNSFVMLSYIGIAATLILTLFGTLTPSPEVIHYTPTMQVDMFGNVVAHVPLPSVNINPTTPGTSPWAFFFTLLDASGMLLCLHTLKKFAA